ncbi:uncharacterized protein TRAVEDRAFT_52762 [Trametes versicolor FP-101664 SS1]|uniref:uncharacterized protein n=1 Tax=Trametes versicolor (strain FP-101664) TaxID=717944 RepID=UPI0004621DFB|nr:uncharacterized protein TRAVEDRAFT_52762 [Trametes versicolor FP-101664 SS1]EIW53642.1 hypothetical protein TRAVEDRAFT_52762 [Trametes versicolor FP-101664 SS1]
MPQLLQCSIHSVADFTLAASSLDQLKKTALKIKPSLHLNTLQLSLSNLPHIQGYPPQGAFGSLVNLTKFVFAFKAAAAVSDSFLQFLGEMVSLEELIIVLRSMQSSHRKKCVIYFRASYQYQCKRGDLLEIISGEAMQQWLQDLPSIPEFIITVDENDAAFNKDWWTTEITKKLPALEDTLMVHVDIDDGVEWYKNLWIEDLPAEAASSINTETNMHINSELDELSAVSEDPYPGIDGSNHEDNTVTEAVSAFQVIE